MPELPQEKRRECGFEQLDSRCVWMDADIERLSSSGCREVKIDILDLLENAGNRCLNLLMKCSWPDV